MGESKANRAFALARQNRQIESLMECFVGLGLLIGLNLVWFPEDPGFLTVSPHPFLFLTILIASRYGTFDGFIAGLLCAGVYSGYAFYGKDWNAISWTFEWHQLIPAYLFIILGLLLGEIREMANREVRRAMTEAGILKERLEASTREVEALTRVKEELQQRILSSDDPLAQFYESAQKLATLRPDEAYPALVDLVGRFTGAEKYGLYLADPEPPEVAGRKPPRTFTLRVPRGWSAPDEFDHVLPEHHPMVVQAMAGSDVVTVREVENAGSDILACAVMRDPVDRTVLGLIVINRIAFVRLTRLTLSHLATIARWAGRTLADARRFDLAMGARVDDEATGVFNRRYLGLRLIEEAARVRRYGGECTYLIVKIQDIETLSDLDRRTLLRALGELLRRQLRNLDLIGLHRMAGTFGAILPETSPSQCVVVVSRINEAFRRALGGYGSRFAHLRLRMGVAGTSKAAPLSDQQIMENAERFDLGQAHPGQGG